MLPLPKLKLIPALLVVAALLIVPAAANATLAYTTNVFHPHVSVAKNDNGKGAKRIGAGSNPKVSPDGELVAFEREPANGKGPEMKLYDVATGKTKTIFSPWRESRPATSTASASPRTARKSPSGSRPPKATRLRAT
jgi:Tol biopolymer transport system component